MSATNRGRSREGFDDYPTPAWVVRSLLRELHLPGGRWLEPCAGSGSIIRTVNEERTDVSWEAFEIQEKYREDLRLVKRGFFQITDYLKTPVNLPNVIITNPPYSLAEEVIRKALREASGAVVMLLRVNFLAGEWRSDFMRRNPPDIYVLPNRPCFRPSRTGRRGSDATEYAWFVWYPRLRRIFGRVKVLAPTPQEARLQDEYEALGIAIPGRRSAR